MCVMNGNETGAYITLLKNVLKLNINRIIFLDFWSKPNSERGTAESHQKLDKTKCIINTLILYLIYY